MGRVIDAVKQLPDADNTLFIYIAGDNGSSAEGGIEGSLNENLFFNGFPEKWQDNLKAIDELGGPKHFNHFPSAWAHAMNTPFQWTKQVASHFGGTRNPMIISWPAKIKDKGGIRSQFIHTIDVVPTIYEVCGITAPTDLNGVQQKPIEGTSFAYTFDDAKRQGPPDDAILRAGVQPRHLPRRLDGVVAVVRRRGSRSARGSTPTKRSGSSTTSTRTSRRRTTWRCEDPQKLRQLARSVVGRGGEVQRAATRLAGRQSADERRVDGPAEPESQDARSWSTSPAWSACPTPPRRRSQQVVDDHRRHRAAEGDESGMIVTQGGIVAGTGSTCTMEDRRSSTTTLALDRPTFAAKEPLPEGKSKIVVDFLYDGGGGLGKGGTVTLDRQRQQDRRRAAGTDDPVQFSIQARVSTSAWMSARRSTSPISCRSRSPARSRR